MTQNFDDMTETQLLDYIQLGTDDRIYAIAQLLRLGCDIDRIHSASAIDAFFLQNLSHIVQMEQLLQEHPGDSKFLKWQNNRIF